MSAFNNLVFLVDTPKWGLIDSQVSIDSSSYTWSTFTMSYPNLSKESGRREFYTTSACPQSTYLWWAPHQSSFLLECKTLFWGSSLNYMWLHLTGKANLDVIHRIEAGSSERWKDFLIRNRYSKSTSMNKNCCPRDMRCTLS